VVSEPAPGFVLALDQGGHASRAVAFDTRGRELAAAHVPVATSRDGTDVVEQDPVELVRSLQVAAQDACDAEATRTLPALSAGLATQRSTIVCWERSSGRALTSAISWQDRRNAAWLEQLKTVATAIRETTGLVLSPHYGASKLRWCLDNVPAVQRAARSNDLAAGPLASFLLSRLLEEKPVMADPANASRTLLFDPELLDWSQSLLDVFGVDRGQLPRCVPTRHQYGHLPAGRRRIALVACTGDQSAAAFAYGPPRESLALVNVGTGAFVQRVAPAGVRLPDGLLLSVLRSDASGALRSHEGTVNGAGSAIDWLAGRVAIDVERALPTLARPSAADPPLFMNGVGGLGAPYWKPDFPVEFIGGGDDLQLLAAVVESVVFLLSVNLEVMRGVAALDRIVISGGLARCDYLCQTLADANGLVVERYALPEATARGIAFLAAGEPADWLVPDIERSFAPATNPALAARYVRWRSEMAHRGAVALSRQAVGGRR
jgi:glycerol kinase